MNRHLIVLPAKYTLPDKSKVEGEVWLTSLELGWNPIDQTAADEAKISLDAVQGAPIALYARLFLGLLFELCLKALSRSNGASWQVRYNEPKASRC